MPGKFEIMRAVQKSLNSLEIDADADDGEWGPVIATKLCDLGRKFGCKVGASKVAEANRDRPEWLYDVTWLEYERERDDLLIDAALVAECEWGNFRKIVYDFEKLLLARAGVRLMIFNGFTESGSKEIAEQLAERVREFNGGSAEDAWLLAAWEGKPEDWSFRYFTINPPTGTLRAFDTSGNPSPLPLR